MSVNHLSICAWVSMTKTHLKELAGSLYVCWHHLCSLPPKQESPLIGPLDVKTLDKNKMFCSLSLNYFMQMNQIHLTVISPLMSSRLKIRHTLIDQTDQTHTPLIDCRNWNLWDWCSGDCKKYLSSSYYTQDILLNQYEQSPTSLFLSQRPLEPGHICILLCLRLIRSSENQACVCSPDRVTGTDDRYKQQGY